MGGTLGNSANNVPGKHKLLIGGDLNQIMHFAEHSKASVNHLSEEIIKLKDVMLNLGMDDLRFQGCSHTWTNKRTEESITKKLDRALVNENWMVSYPNSVTTFLPFSFSDHTPCLIDLACPLPSSGSKPFKFQNYLTKHPSFHKSVESAWDLCGLRASDLSTLGFKLKQIKKHS